MKHSATRELFNYWNDLRGERAAPERSEIDPAAIRTILADTFMLDVDMAGRFPFRLAGTRVNALFDAEQKGRSFLDIWRNEERRNLAAILSTVADSAAPVVAGGITSGGEHECALELLFLPLKHHGKTHSRILGLVKLATRPAWLGMVPAETFSLRSLRMIDADECDLQRRPLRRVAVGQRMTLSEMAQARESALPRRPHLRLIKGGL